MKNFSAEYPLPGALRGLTLAGAGLALVAGLSGALIRIGTWPLLSDMGRHVHDNHGALMIFGFTVGAIVLERSVALRLRLGMVAPVVGVAATLVLIFLGSSQLAAAGYLLEVMLLLATYAVLLRRSPMMALLIEATGAVALVGGALSWLLCGDFVRSVPLVLTGLILTIMGERVELSRVGRILASATSVREEVVIFLVGFALVVVALLLTMSPAGNLTSKAMGVVFAELIVATAVACWRNDICRKTIRGTGLARYSAAAMILGYAWLLVGSVAWLLFTLWPAAGTWDAAVHAVCVGFVMSMIFGHAPIIVHGVIAKPFPYHPVLYAPLALTTLALLVRVVSRIPTLAWHFGSLVGVVAIALFMVCAVSLVAGKGLRLKNLTSGLNSLS